MNIISISLLFISMFSVSSHFLQANNYQDRLAQLAFIKDPTNRFGFDDHHIEANGELIVIQKLIYNNDIVFDVGANRGDWSSHVLRAAPRANIYAFEPLPCCYQKLSQISALFFQVYPFALSNKAGISKFTYYPKVPELSSIYERPILTNDFHLQAEVCEVKTITLDDFCSDYHIKHIDFLKIDTEGSEWDIFQGAKQMIEGRRIGIIQFEYGGTYLDAHTRLQDVYNYLTAQGYSMYRITQYGLIAITQWSDGLENYRLSNYLAVQHN